MATPSTQDAESYALPIHEETGRPLWRGLPVPWLTRWSSEAPPPITPTATRLDGTLWFSYGDPSSHPLGVRAGIMSQRDDMGLLWYREGSVYGTGSDDTTIQDYTTIGEPQWGEVHAMRQRACMLERRCQVCGQPIGSDPAMFLVDPKELPALFLKSKTGAETWLSIAPPVCQRCMPIALKLCPHQRWSPPLVIRAASYRPSFVYADLPIPSGWLRQQLPLGDPRLAHASVKQLGVTLTEYTLVPA